MTFIKSHLGTRGQFISIEFFLGPAKGARASARGAVAPLLPSPLVPPSSPKTKQCQFSSVQFSYVTL